MQKPFSLYSFFLLFMLYALVVQGQTDTLSSGLKILNLNIKEDRYTGINYASNELISTFQDLHSKLSTNTQDSIKYYLIDPYRYRPDGAPTPQDDFEMYRQNVASLSKYYVIVGFKLDSDRQNIGHFVFLMNLPSAEVPAMQSTSAAEVERICTLFLSNSYSKLESNIARVPDAMAVGLQEVVKFLFNDDLNLIDDQEGGGPVQLSTLINKGAAEMPSSMTFLLSTGELLSLPINANVWFSQCDQKTVPKGAMYKFQLPGDTRLYYRWFLANDPEFKTTEWATAIQPEPANGKKVDTNNIFSPTLTTSSSNIYSMYSDGVQSRAYALTCLSCPDYHPNSKKPKKENVLAFCESANLRFPIEIGTDVCNPGSPNPFFSWLNTDALPEGTYNEQDKWTIGYTESSPLMAAEIFDYTGRFSNLKLLALNSISLVNGLDIAITDDQTDPALIQTISNAQPVSKGLLWIKLDYRTKIFYCQLIPSQQFVGTQRVGLDKAFADGIQKIASRLNEGDNFLAILSFNRLMWDIVNEGAKNLRLGEKWYNDHPTNSSYYISDPAIRAALKAAGLNGKIALFCGFYNSVFDNLMIITAVGQLVDPLTYARLAFDSEYQAELESRVAEIGEFIGKLGDSEFQNKLLEKYSLEYQKVSESSLKQYYSGYIGTEIAIGYLTAGLATVAKQAFTGARTFENLADVCQAAGKLALREAEASVFFISNKFATVKNLGTNTYRLIKDGHEYLMDNIGRILVPDLDAVPLMPAGALAMPSTSVNVIKQGGSTSRIMLMTSGGDLYRIGATLVEQLANKLDVSPSKLSALVDETLGIGSVKATALLDDAVANAIKAITPEANRAKFIDDLIASRSNGIGKFADELTAGHIKAWEKMIPDELLRRDVSWLTKVSAYFSVKPNKVDEFKAHFEIEKGKGRASAYLKSLTERKIYVGSVYRNQQSSLGYEDFFSNGMVPNGSHDNLLMHTESNTTAGNFISTSLDKEIASQFGSPNGWVFDIRSTNGIDINKTLGANALHPGQFEVSIPDLILPKDIKGAWQKQGGVLTTWIPNPNYIP